MSKQWIAKGRYAPEHNLFNIQTFTGKEAPIHLLDDVFNTLKETGGGVVLSGIVESQWAGYEDYLAFHLKRMQEHNISNRVLLCEGDRDLLPYLDVEKTYRWISKELFAQILYYVYADKFALVLWGKPVRIIVIQNHLVADTFRRQFEVNWKNGKIPVL